jgi:very-short-patch-repair endonuclease
MRGARHFERTRSRDLRRQETPAEALLWGKLRGRRLAGCKFVRQEAIAPYFADFVCREAKLIVEVDGATHATAEERAYDARREATLRAASFEVLRFSNDEVFRDIDAVCEAIVMALQKNALPSPRETGRGLG